MLPFFSGRAETLWAQLGSRSAGDDYGDILKRMSKPLIDYYRSRGLLVEVDGGAAMDAVFRSVMDVVQVR